MSEAIATRNSNKAALTSVIDALLAGNPLREAVKVADMTPSQFHKLLSSDREAAVAYAQALQMRADLLVDDAIALADGDGDPAKVRNQVEIRKWLATKQHSQRYGERVELNVSQTIDIGSTLAEARARMLRPVYDQLPTVDVQTIDLQSESTLGLIDKQSKRPIYQDIPAPDAEPDIFS